MYAHVNSTMTLGSKMLNGLGGSGDFLRNAKLSIVHAPSSRPSKTDPTGISSIVPFVSHIDQCVLRSFLNSATIADVCSFETALNMISTSSSLNKDSLMYVD